MTIVGELVIRKTVTVALPVAAAFDLSTGEVEVRFEPDGDGTRVELEHRGWEHYGDEAEQAMAGYEGGWDVVLGRYLSAGAV